jgi:hypothetical protein
VVPATLPTQIDLDVLFDSSPGDGVPLGLVDDPARGDVRTRWWELGSGSLFAFGSRRSGVEQALATNVLGIIDRFSELDVRLVVVEPSATRRRAIGGVDRHIRIVAPDQHEDVAAALDEIESELAHEDGGDGAHDAGRPRLVVVIDDVVGLRRRYAGQPLGNRIDTVLHNAAVPGSGVDVLASASELDGAGPFALVASHRLVGASSDHRELAELGVEQPGDVEGVVGRCRAFPGGDLVQLAMSDATTETLLERRSTGAVR